MKFKALALACAILAGNASASVLIDFEGVGNGASVNDYYNGGTDSLGNAGVNYGIHFAGGTVTYGSNGAVIHGPFTMTFVPSIDITRFDFQYALPGASGGVFVLSTMFGTDFNYLDPTTNPSCSTQAQCAAIHSVYIAPDQLFSGRVLFEPGMGVYQIGMRTWLADNLLFTSATWNAPASDPATGTVPEPGSIALLGLGALGLLGARRRKSVKSENA